ncbi:hypothetical protein BDB00DRAFT_846083 [Zychaea mexicana]|uniref:uncharacterized protein n=1 Tax=Zychaea mexicana TaxID=64656 RepID=UPI0022FF16EC|nr:uncharacterized protein BDB00DRAFT_846083 [Zychaea mexicana]KAI9488881.1 hypothetical protein BDB00DRAFT_846083 [Zychaea mexicana]
MSLHNSVVTAFRNSECHTTRPPQHPRPHQQPAPPIQPITATQPHPPLPQLQPQSVEGTSNSTNDPWDRVDNYAFTFVNPPVSPTGSQTETHRFSRPKRQPPPISIPAQPQQQQQQHESTTPGSSLSARSRYESINVTSPRSRTESQNSNVQFTPASSKFENLKLQAMHLWTSGVDLELKKAEQPIKKKASSATWLTESEFTSMQPPAAEKPLSPAQPVESSSSFSTDGFIKTSTSNLGVTHGGYARKDTRSFAEAASSQQQQQQEQQHSSDNDTDAWSPEQEDLTPAVHTLPFATHRRGPSSTGPMPLSCKSGRTLVNSMSAAIPAGAAAPPSTITAGVGNMPALDHNLDAQMYQDLYVIYSDLHGSHTLTKFYVNADEFLRQSPRMSSRTFGMLIETLVSVAALEKRPTGTLPEGRNVFNRMIPSIAPFTQALQGYLQFHVLTPREMMPVLELCSMFALACPRSATRMPLGLIQQTYDQIKTIFNHTNATRAKAYLYEISSSLKPETGFWGSSNADANNGWENSQAVQNEVARNGADGWWRSMSQLPSIPDGKELLQQVARRMKRTAKGRWICTDDPLLPRIVNIVQGEHPGMHVYLMTQFMLLWEEMCGPVQQAMQRHVESITNNEAQENGTVSMISNNYNNDEEQEVLEGCSVYTDLYVCGTTLFPTVSEPAVVFHALVDCEHYPFAPQEGSFAVLISNERQVQPTFSKQRSSAKVESAMVLTGTIVYGKVVSSKIIIGVHLRDSQLSTARWSARYTLIAANANAASIYPVLDWYRLQVEQSNDTLPELASSLLTPATSQRPGELEDNRDMPEYLHGLELDLSCIMLPQYQNANVILGSKGKSTQWPMHRDQTLAPSLRSPMYILSPTQLAAVQHALTHKVSVISGGEGTGKTFLVTKLVELIHQSLVSAQCFQPILILTKNENTLDSILTQVIKKIPDLVRLGRAIGNGQIGHRQLIKAAAPNPTDPNRKYAHAMERKLATLQGQLSALWSYRQRVVDAEPRVMVTTIPPQYVVEFQSGYTRKTGMPVQPSHEYPLEVIWSRWMGETKQQRPASSANVDSNLAFGATYATLAGSTLSETGQFMPPIMERDYYIERRKWIERHAPFVGSISNAEHWPFSNSESGSHVRLLMKKVWSMIKPQDLWDLPQGNKDMVQQQVISALLKIIDININGLLTQQAQAAKVVEESRLAKWVNISRFSRVVGVTADFAAAHYKVLESLWPRAVIMDEAQSILESVSAPFVLGSRVQQVIMIGDAHARQRPTVHNPKLKGSPKNLDISLFERWRLGGGYITRLEEQWRMCSDIVGIHDSLATPEADRKLLITAPIAGENKGDQCTLELVGLNDRAFFVDYQVPKDAINDLDPLARRFTGKDIKMVDLDEARYVAHLTLYLYQQNYKAHQITILTVSPTQKILVQMVLRELASTPNSFVSSNSTIAIVDTVDNYVGKESHFVILSLAMPCNNPIPEGNISLALSRARSGLYMVGRVKELQETAWSNVIQYMKDRGLCEPNIELQCQKHKDQISLAANHADFILVKNGGCTKLCDTLLDCGHVCKETCHHMKHSNIMCQQSCERARPEGCKHKCRNKCYQCHNKCPPCDVFTEMGRECGHIISGPCHKLPELCKTTPCLEKVQHEFPCGHSISVECHRVSSASQKELVCQEVVQVTLECGHTVETQCCYEPICTERCPERLDCGHSCPERCGTDHRLHARADCTASCSKQLICGHYCAKGCANPDDHTERCVEPCQHVCSHGYRCGRDCWMVCNACLQPCPYKCEHLQCTKKCHERCDRPPCNERCTQQLDCGHICSGLCGEPCPPCKQCSSDRVCSISLRTLAEFDDEELVYMLPECECVFAVESLDLYFQTQAKNGEHTAIKLWQCPSCQKPIYTALRYNVYIKTEIALVNQIKAQQEAARQLISQQEKTDIIQAMNAETRTSINNIVGGRWFVCENGHPYFIGDCGGATQIASCPQCGAVIGGLQHKVVESNRFYGEFDGSYEPAWPGQPG